MVKVCIDKTNNTKYAVKIQTLDREQIVYMKKNFTDIKSLYHANILRYRSIYFEMKNRRSYLVMDYFPYPELETLTIESEQ